MADDGDEAGHQSNADDVVADLLHQRTDDLVEHACIGHDAEEQDGEDEQDSRTVDALDALLDKAGHFIQGESTGSHQNGCGDGRDADECQCRDRDIAQQQNDDRNHRCKAEQSEDSVTHWFVLPFLFFIYRGCIPFYPPESFPFVMVSVYRLKLTAQSPSCYGLLRNSLISCKIVYGRLDTIECNTNGVLSDAVCVVYSFRLLLICARSVDADTGFTT